MKRFWDKVDVRGSDDCWLWTAFIDDYGYGRILFGKTMAGAHVVSYTINIGDIPAGKQVCHICDVRHCVNPRHLFLGDYSINATDMHRKGRHPTAKMNMDLARDIRWLYMQGIMQKELMQYYEVAKNTVWGIIHCQIWKES